jgi:hypothetical protein
MADTANEVRIGEISAQLTKASRLVLSTDGFWVQTGGDSQGNSQSVLIPAEFVRAYLADGIKPSIGEDGMWYINGKSTGVVAKGVTPLLRGGVKGVEASYDNGKTWTQVSAYSDINVDVASLETAYRKVTDSESARVEAESGRVKAEEDRAKAESSRADAEKKRETAEAARAESETARADAETARASAETQRANAETQRESDFSSAKAACETAASNANSAADNANTAAENAKADYVGTDNYVYRWDSSVGAYKKTSLNVKGDKGDTGATGATGPKGDKGDKGDPLTYASLTEAQKKEMASMVSVGTISDTEISSITDA